MMPTLQGQLFQSKIVRPKMTKHLGSDSFPVTDSMAMSWTFGALWINATDLNFKLGAWVENIAGPVNILAYIFEMASEENGGGVSTVTTEQASVLVPGAIMWLPAPPFPPFSIVNEPELANYVGNFASFRIGLRRAGPAAPVNDTPVNLKYIGS